MQMIFTVANVAQEEDSVKTVTVGGQKHLKLSLHDNFR